MKKIFFGANGRQPHHPFWNPWGFGGFLWRALCFLLLAGGVVLLVSILPRCGRGGGYASADIPDEFRDRDPIGQTPVDTVGDWYDNNIEDPGEFLPTPDDNYLEPLDPGDLVTDPEDGRQYAGNLVNVMLDSESNDETFRTWASSFKRNYPGEGYKINYYDPLTKLLQITVPDGQVNAMVAELPQKITEVKFLPFPEGVMGPSARRPNDPVFDHSRLSWYFAPIEAQSAWDVTMGSPDVTVAIVDTYFDLRHDDLNSGRIVKPFSLTHRNANVAPDGEVNPALPREMIGPTRAHGTFVAAVAVGNGNNGRGSIGIAPKCKLMPVSMGMNLSSMRMLQGMLYAIYQGADVVNISAGMCFGPQAAQLPVDVQIQIASQMCKPEQTVWDYAFNLADKRKVTIVWAAGNENIFTAMDPSKRGPNTIKVSAVGPNLHKASFSSFGNFPSRGIYESTVSAPGQAIFAAVPSNQYAIQDGTSFSAPIVAGAVALMKSKDKNLTNQQIIQILKETGAPVSGCNTIGPLIKIRKALDKI